MLRFNIHGIILDVQNGSKQLRNYLRKELEFFLNEEKKEPDIRIDFISRLALPSKLKSIGNLAEYGNNKFFIRLQASRVLFPFYNIGKKMEIKSEVSIPLNRVLESIIEPAVYFKLLTKNFAFIHSSAVFFRKIGIIFPAWTYAGKTELLFEFMKKGAHFMSDDWTFVSDSGNIFAYPRPIWIYSRNFRYFTEILGKLSSKSFVPKRKKFSLRSSISSLEGAHRISFYDAFPSAPTQMKCNLSIIVHLLRYKGKGISIVREDPDVIVERIISMTKYARMSYFLPFYALYKFAFPKKRNPIIESAEEVERKILQKAFRKKPVYSLKIPIIANPSYVCDILLDTLFKT
ncbi:MAG: hypothetical protein ACFFCW_05835 [Candidatus Hodarchaeota archaeon]